MEDSGVVRSKAVAPPTSVSRESRHFVDPEEYLNQLVSRRHLFRCDDEGSNVRGLWDPATGDRIFVEDRLLIQFDTTK